MWTSITCPSQWEWRCLYLKEGDFLLETAESSGFRHGLTRPSARLSAFINEVSLCLCLEVKRRSENVFLLLPAATSSLRRKHLSSETQTLNPAESPATHRNTQQNKKTSSAHKNQKINVFAISVSMRRNHTAGSSLAYLHFYAWGVFFCNTLPGFLGLKEGERAIGGSETSAVKDDGESCRGGARLSKQLLESLCNSPNLWAL